jgi:putative cofactor-binding repeat protein
MKHLYGAVTALLVGAGIGAATVQAVHAQAKPPIYMIAINDVKDADCYKNDYLPKASPTIKAHGGIYVAAGTGTVVDGELPKGRTVILRWDSMEQMLGWRHSPEYEAARTVGSKCAVYNIVAVEGVKQ